MNKYHNGKIYKIVDVGYSKCYIGSTCESLSRRFSKHKHHYKTHDKDNNKRYCRCFDLFDEYGVDNCKIELIEFFKSDTKDELLAREGQHQQQNECINKKISGRNKTQWYEDNKDRLKEDAREYRDIHREEIKEYLKSHYQENKHKYKEYKENHREQKRQHDKKYRDKNKDIKIDCACGSNVSKLHWNCHLRTKKHQDYLKSLEQD